MTTPALALRPIVETESVAAEVDALRSKPAMRPYAEAYDRAIELLTRRAPGLNQHATRHTAGVLAMDLRPAGSSNQGAMRLIYRLELNAEGAETVHVLGIGDYHDKK